MQSYFIRRLLKVCDNNVSQAKQELRWITQHVLNQTKNNYYNCNNIQQLDEKEKQTIALMVNDRVEKYKPLQYILGTQPFCDLEIITKPPVLIPSRWETEEWTNRLITKINSRIFSKNQKGIKNNNDINRNGYLDRAEGKQIEILDICTGSGCNDNARTMQKQNFLRNNFEKATQCPQKQDWKTNSCYLSSI
ncbi:11719_t:CDS:2 [Entrophospora sp. SA101]|nr:11719_t:CDS:2 [Entrophospora sp. SA101]